MTASELKRKHKANTQYHLFFEPKTMAFFGDTMSNYGVRAQPVTIDTHAGPVLSWVLYRKRPNGMRLQSDAHFSCDTFQRVYPKP